MYRHFLDLLLRSAGVWCAAGGFEFAAEMLFNKGIVIYCGIFVVGVVWIPNSRCNCSNVNTILLGLAFLHNISERLAFVMFALVEGVTVIPIPEEEAVNNQKWNMNKIFKYH